MKCRYCNVEFANQNDFYLHIRSSTCSDQQYRKNKLTEETITFGKYKDLNLSYLLRDRKYCEWLLKQDWFIKQYEYLYNRVLEHKPLDFFLKKEARFASATKYEDKDNNPIETFIANYKCFNLLPCDKLQIELSENEKICYRFYLFCIEKIKNKLLDNTSDNPFNIKAPTSWLKDFEKEYGLSRDIFKEFLTAYELPNITSIIEDIKKQGGIEYKGAKSYIIAKKNSLQQEFFWENLLKQKYGEDIGSQFKYRNCIFDFINIKSQILYECKIGLKDFNTDQHNKYMLILNTEYFMIYLISNDCIIDIKNSVIYTINFNMYKDYILKIPIAKEPSKFDRLIEKFTIIEIDSLIEYL